MISMQGSNENSVAWLLPYGAGTFLFLYWESHYFIYIFDWKWDGSNENLSNAESAKKKKKTWPTGLPINVHILQVDSEQKQHSSPIDVF